MSTCLYLSGCAEEDLNLADCCFTQFLEIFELDIFPRNSSLKVCISKIKEIFEKTKNLGEKCEKMRDFAAKFMKLKIKWDFCEVAEVITEEK